MAKYKVAYGSKDDIESTIAIGKIPPGTIILTDDSNEMYFYDLDCNLKAYQEKYKFESKEEAGEWVRKYNCRGEIISVHEEDVCNIYLVDYEGNMNPVKAETPSPDDALSLCIDMGLITPISSTTGKIYTDRNGRIYVV